MRRVVLAAMLIAAVGVLTFDAPAQAAGGQVHAASNTFNDGPGCSTSPGETTTIVVDEAVTWHNCDGVSHTVTSDDGTTFNEALPSGGPDVAITFHTAGSYPYHCTIHGTGMKGTVVVTAAATTTTTQQTTTPPTQATTTTKLTTTTSSTTPASTTTTGDINGVFDGSTISTGPTTTIFTTDTTRALGQGGDTGTSAGVVAGLILGLGAVGTAGALIVRRMRSGTPPS